MSHALVRTMLLSFLVLLSFALHQSYAQTDKWGNQNTGIVCENKNFKLSCDYGYSIRIVDFFWGRSSGNRNDCPTFWLFLMETGKYTKSTTTIKNMCEYRRTCSGSASSGTFGDVSPGTLKYLQVYWRCQKDNTKLICENQDMNITCPTNTQIQMYKAFFGRVGESLCREGILWSTRCGYPATDLRVSGQKCNGKRQCIFRAEPNWFGYDPCGWTKKYLNMTWECVSA